MKRGLTYIDIVRKYYPKIANRGYTLYSNINRQNYKIEIPKIEEKAKGEKRFWDNNYYILTGKIFVDEKLEARWHDGTIDLNLIPVFAEYKQVKKKVKQK